MRNRRVVVPEPTWLVCSTDAVITGWWLAEAGGWIGIHWTGWGTTVDWVGGAAVTTDRADTDGLLVTKLEGWTPESAVVWLVEDGAEEDGTITTFVLVDPRRVCEASENADVTTTLAGAGLVNKVLVTGSPAATRRWGGFARRPACLFWECSAKNAAWYSGWRLIQSMNWKRYGQLVALYQL